MFFSKVFLAAGLTASAFAAPIDFEEDIGECEFEPEPSSSNPIIVAATTSTATSSSVASSTVEGVSTQASSLSSAKSMTVLSTVIPTSPAAGPSTSAIVVSTVVSTSATVSPSATSSSSGNSTAASGKLQWVGINESGAEFGSNIPGVAGTDYEWPLASSIETLLDQGLNIIRVPFLMERLAQGTMTATLDPTYLAGLMSTVSTITAAGAHAIVDAHNYGRYPAQGGYGPVFTSTSDFQTFWQNVASEFKDNSNVIFDCNNEFHDLPSIDLLTSMNQACIDGVRAAGATTQYIFVEGTLWSGAGSWVSSGSGDALVDLTDPSDMIVYEMHQYLDGAGGTEASCTSTTVGSDNLVTATQWLQQNNKKGILGEFAGGVNSVCESAVTGTLDALAASNDVWLGALWWAAGPMWGDYMFSVEPSSGPAYSTYVPVLTKYV